MWVWYSELLGERGGRKNGGSGSTKAGLGLDVEISQELVFQLYRWVRPAVWTIWKGA